MNKSDNGDKLSRPGRGNKAAIEVSNSRNQIIDELSAMKNLHELVANLLRSSDLESALKEVLRASIKMSGAKMGNVQLYNPQTHTLEIVCQQGFNRTFLQYFESVTINDNSACGIAMKKRERVIIEDVDVDPEFASHREVARAAGYRSVQSTPLMSRNGELLGMLSTHYPTPGLPTEDEIQILDLYARQAADFIELVRNRDALQRSESRFKTFTEAMPQMAFIADSKGNIIYYNQRWYDFVGKIDGTEGWGWKEKPIHHPDDLQRTVERWSESVSTKKPYEIEYRLRRHDGAYRWHLGRAIPMLDSDGNVEIWLGTNTDIHEQKMAEEALRQSEEFNRTLLESSPDCVKALDLEGRLISMNSQGQKMLEIDDFSTLKGIQWTDLWRGEFYDNAVSALKTAQQSGVGRFQGFRPTTKGTPKWWDVIISPVYGADRNVERLVCVSRDITQIKELERQKDEFIGVASHELKTPVTSIKGSVQIIRHLFKDKAFDKIENFLAKAEQHVDKLTTLINDLLDVSKIQSGKLQYDFSRFQLEDIIVDCVEQVSHQTRKHKIIVKGDLSIDVFGDKVRLEQVVTNLLTNAIKYSPDAEEVILETSKTAKDVKVSVTDFGIGIPGEHIGRVFDRFFRVESNSHRFQGLGLGLYISAEIVKRHHSSLKVKSTPGKGSTFYFSLPLE